MINVIALFVPSEVTLVAPDVVDGHDRLVDEKESKIYIIFTLR